MTFYELDGLRPEVPASGAVWVAEEAVVIGRVILGEDVGIWFNAVLRGDNESITIGARSNIQDGAMLHTDLGFPLDVGAGCTIGHHAILHGCTIGENSLIGMGATILNGARIGANSIVGANALVSEGKDFPDFSLIVGVPARVVRQLDPDAAAALKVSAAGYIVNARRYAKSLKRIDYL
jgi:carbonic anhydrase/acetyltransferase-like protein (isoleucine patch superfamily)